MSISFRLLFYHVDLNQTWSQSDIFHVVVIEQLSFVQVAINVKMCSKFDSPGRTLPSMIDTVCPCLPSSSVRLKTVSQNPVAAYSPQRNPCSKFPFQIALLLLCTLQKHEFFGRIPLRLNSIEVQVKSFNRDGKTTILDCRWICAVQSASVISSMTLYRV